MSGHMEPNAADPAATERIDARIAAFWSAYPNGRIVTELETSGDTLFVCAEVYRDCDRHYEDATGYAAVTDVSDVSHAERSAVIQALTHLGISGDGGLATTPVNRPSSQPATERTTDGVSSGQESTPIRQGGNQVLEPTERQRKLIDVLRSQLNLDDAELSRICQDETGYPFDANAGRKTASSLIEALQRIKLERSEGKASDGQTTPPNGGTAGTGETVTDDRVQTWLHNIKAVGTMTRLTAVRAGIREAGLSDHPALVAAISEREAALAQGDEQIPF